MGRQLPIVDFKHGLAIYLLHINPKRWLTSAGLHGLTP